MFLAKFAVLVGAFYVLSTVLLEAILYLILRARGIIGFQKSFFGLALLFGLVWFLSFNVAWQILKPKSLRH
jgi:hypothetical protein